MLALQLAPVLREGLGLARCQEGKIWLVVCVHARCKAGRGLAEGSAGQEGRRFNGQRAGQGGAGALRVPCEPEPRCTHPSARCTARPRPSDSGPTRTCARGAQGRKASAAVPPTRRARARPSHLLPCDTCNTRHPPKLVVAPGPLLLAGRDVVVGHVNHARARAVVVAAEKVLGRGGGGGPGWVRGARTSARDTRARHAACCRLSGGGPAATCLVGAAHHVGRGHRDVLVPVQPRAGPAPRGRRGGASRLRLERWRLARPPQPHANL